MNIHVNKTQITLTLLTFGLIIISGLRLFGWANDTANYYEIVSSQNELLLEKKEIAFRIIIFINNFFFDSNFTVFLLIFALLGVSIKMYSLAKLSPLPLLSVILYLLSYFWLHEYIQIRVGVATGIFLLATKDLADKNSKKYFIKAFFAIMFHWSSIVMIPIYFLVKCKKLKVYIFLPIIGIILNIAQVNFSLVIELALSALGIDPMIYKMYAGYQNNINVFNVINLSYLLIFYTITAVILTRKNILNDYEIVLYKIFSIGIFIFFLVSLLNAPVVAFRILEYFMIVLLVLIPLIVVKFKQKIFISSFAILYYCIYCYYMFSNVFSFGKGV